jgi:hypothetical protein
MKWQEIRTYFPQQWLLVEAIQARSESDRRILEQLAVIGAFDDQAAAESSRQQLQRQAPGRELYVFHTSQETLDVASESTEQSVDTRDINAPLGIEVASTPDKLRISWKYLGKGATLVAGAWPIVLLGMFFSGSDTRHLLLIPLAILALGTTYYFLLWRMNEMVVQVDQVSLEIKWEGPIPNLYRGRKFNSAHIKQVYIHSWESGGRGLTTVNYDVCIWTVHDQHKRFATVSSGEQALYLEQEIERFLGIEDQVMRGEWRPGPYLQV